MKTPETEFVIYMINEIANRNNLHSSYVYNVLNETGCIKNYLIPFYDVLHTMGSESVANEIKEYVRLRGATL